MIPYTEKMETHEICSTWLIRNSESFGELLNDNPKWGDLISWDFCPLSLTAMWYFQHVLGMPDPMNFVSLDVGLIVPGGCCGLNSEYYIYITTQSITFSPPIT